MVFDSTAKSTAIEDCVFWYRADLHPEGFQMGKPIYTRYHKEYERSDGNGVEYDEDDDQGDGGGKAGLMVRKVAENGRPMPRR